MKLPKICFVALIRKLASVGVLSAAALAGAQTPLVTGSIEGYFIDQQGHRGFTNQLEWGELNIHPNTKFDVTASYLLFPTGHSWDEAFAKYGDSSFSLRLGRMRTAFGFNSWAELFYNGFNHLPLVRQMDLVDDLSLTREDSGAELTTHIGDTQVQAAIFDDDLTRDQILPENIDHGSMRIQHAFGPLIAGGDLLSSRSGDEKVGGFDLRYTLPQVILRAEAFWGNGDDPAEGFYIDGSYRLPKLFRTQVVARFEEARPFDEPLAQLTTVGVRQIVNQYFSFNLNYATGTRSSLSEYSTQLVSTGWSARAMFRLAF